jgi:hypothetical protein
LPSWTKAGLIDGQGGSGQFELLGTDLQLVDVPARIGSADSGGGEVGRRINEARVNATDEEDRILNEHDKRTELKAHQELEAQGMGTENGV